MPSFSERAVESGLTPNLAKGMYGYRDQYCEVLYRHITTFPSLPVNVQHPTDNHILPMLTVYTKGPDDTDYKYCGYVSDSYQFSGNETLIASARESIRNVGMPVLVENNIMNGDYTVMRHEMIIESPVNVPQAGDFLPVIIINNGYNGNRAKCFSFGIATYENSRYLTFSFKLGQIRQVHLASADTNVHAFATTYVQAFSENITDLITNSFNNQLTLEDMFATLDLVEKIGKNKREEVANLLKEINPQVEGEEPRMPTSWQLFLAIVRYSSFEPNMNKKRLLESAAESVLIIPPRMMEVLERLERN